MYRLLSALKVKDAMAVDLLQSTFDHLYEHEPVSAGQTQAMMTVSGCLETLTREQGEVAFDESRRGLFDCLIPETDRAEQY